MFIDEAVIEVHSGKGGDGVVHFRREKYVPRGGPDGGDGGRGGDVILEVYEVMNTLSAFRHQLIYRAREGGRGGSKNMTGKSADPLIIRVPPGTVVFDNQSNEVLGDLVEPNQRLVIAVGGRGGKGNSRFANSRDQAPRHAEHGEPGESKELRLELKLIADVGIVGVPNAGKSTLLAAVTNARPKIAPYPFTTIEPNLGVAELDEDTVLVLADIPGLIEGAHMGVGLGHDFLRHIQRTRVLIHLLDGMADDPVLDFAQINTELALFDPHLAKKPQIVAVTKMDLPEVQQRFPKLLAALKKRGLKGENELMPISAVSGLNVRQLLYKASQRLVEVPVQEQVDITPVYHMADDPRQFEIERSADGWRVSGKAIERAAAMTYWEYDASVMRFQKILKTLGIEDALRQAGVQDGDMVFIGDYELEWSN